MLARSWQWCRCVWRRLYSLLKFFVDIWNKIFTKCESAFYAEHKEEGEGWWSTTDANHTYVRKLACRWWWPMGEFMVHTVIKAPCHEFVTWHQLHSRQYLVKILLLVWNFLITYSSFWQPELSLISVSTAGLLSIWSYSWRTACNSVLFWCSGVQLYTLIIFASKSATSRSCLTTAKGLQDLL